MQPLMRESGLTDGMAKKLSGLLAQRDSFVRLLERCTRPEHEAKYLDTVARLDEEIESLREAVEYNRWLEDEVSRGPWVEIAITNIEEHDPMDGVHIEIVDEDPDSDPPRGHIEVEIADLDPEADRFSL